MTPEERRRAGRAVAERMSDLGLTAPQLAKQAGVHPGTVRAMIKGQRTPHRDNVERIVAALGWQPGELSRRIWAVPVSLADATTAELAAELCQRLTGHQIAS